METITTYLNGNVKLFDIAAVIVGWLLFNSGFFAGAVWNAMHKREDEPHLRRHAPRCQPRLKV